MADSTVHRFHPPLGARSSFAPDLPEAEALLGETFGVHCVLASSGRAALNLLLTDFGLSRYAHFISSPRFISRCVLDVVVRHGFPLSASNAREADAILRYHQYGLPQGDLRNDAVPAGRCIDDVCHTLFWSGNRGGVGWLGDVAIFSLPKFVSLSAMVGGVFVKDAATAARLREARDRTEAFSDSEQASQSAAFLRGYDGAPAEGGRSNIYISNERCAVARIGKTCAGSRTVLSPLRRSASGAARSSCNWFRPCPRPRRQRSGAPTSRIGDPSLCRFLSPTRKGARSLFAKRANWDSMQGLIRSMWRGTSSIQYIGQRSCCPVITSFLATRSTLSARVLRVAQCDAPLSRRSLRVTAYLNPATPGEIFVRKSHCSGEIAATRRIVGVTLLIDYDIGCAFGRCETIAGHLAFVIDADQRPNNANVVQQRSRVLVPSSTATGGVMWPAMLRSLWMKRASSMRQLVDRSTMI